MPVTSHTEHSLPIGTVTFLFTDIEGSTRLWETQQGVMQQALAQHDAILREAIESNGGVLVKSTGDGVLAVFAIAVDAIAACLGAQRALAAHSLGDLRIKSRMALHSGAAEQRAGDYYGPVLNRAARLMAAGHGGQILLSLATLELVRDELPSEIVLRDMGERRLPDLIRSERVYQVLAPDLRADFPPLRTLDARPNNLPAQATHFIGRDDAVRALKRKLSDANVRLLTLSGVGGTGKTRLALQVAAEVVDEFEHGVFFVPLAALTDSTLVLSAVAKALAVRESDEQLLPEQLQDLLREKQVLLVLDNFEQVIDAAPRMSELLAAAPRLKVLVTSRETLRLSGETDYPVPPLSLPDPRSLPALAQLAQYEAVALFIERAMAVKPTFAFTGENASAVAQICHRLDGLPLAIELAAARVRALPPQRILVELHHRLDFLVGGARNLPARQKTLRGAIDWSHDLLTVDERTLFRRVAVFVGGATLDAIATVCDGESNLNVIETIDSLVGKSLLMPPEIDGEPRFAMLETIREYALDRLQGDGEGERVRERHWTYFTELVVGANPKMAGAEQVALLNRLEEEHNNLRSALDWALVGAGSGPGPALRLCGSMQRFWLTRGHLTEGRQWCERVLAASDGHEPTVDRARVVTAAGSLANYQGDYRVAEIRHKEGLAIYRRLGDRRGIATSLNNLGTVANCLDDQPAAVAMYEECLQIMRELGDRPGIAAALNNLGNAAHDQCEFARAQALHEECLALHRKLGDPGGVADSLGNLGNVVRALGNYPVARALHEESLALRRQLDDRYSIAVSLDNLGHVAHDEGDLLAAAALHREGLTLRRELGDKRGIALSLEGLAALVAVFNGAPCAARVWGGAERLREEIGSPLSQSERRQYDGHVSAARKTLGDDVAFDVAWQEGRTLTLEQASELALQHAMHSPTTRTR